MSDTMNNRAEPTCAEVEQLLPVIADGALDAEADPMLFAHIAQCTVCQEALARHDLITLAIGRHGAAPAAAPRLAVVHFRLPRLVAWASAACLVAALGSAAWWMRSGPSAAPAIVDREVIRVTDPSDPQGRGYLLIHEGAQWQRIDPGHLDGERSPAAGHDGDSVSVGYRY